MIGSTTNRWLRYLLLGIISGSIFHFALAHDHNHPELSEWYAHLNGRGPCCDGSEAEMKHVADENWRTVDGHYQVLINQYMDGSGKDVWVDVPDDAVIKEPNKDGRTLVWPIWGDHPQVRCFLPGAGM